MLSKPHAVLVFLSLLFSVAACDFSDSGKNYPDSEMYNFSKPNVVKLPQELDEISGIAYYAKDTSLFAIIDEGGDIYKFPLKDPKKLRKWKFDKKRDFEDIVLTDSTFYILESNGDITKLTFKNNQFFNERLKIGDISAKENEFESMFGSPDSSYLVIMCKDCPEDSKKTLSTFAFHYMDSTDQFQKHLVYDISTLHQKLGIEKRLHPSAAAINPITKDIYIVSSIQKILLILNSKGEFKSFYKLNPGIYKQPEGIAFTPEGDLIISNEFAEEGFANLLLLKNKMKKK
jgi:uncharacterized protein YjiK